MRYLLKRLNLYLLNHRWVWVRTIIFFYDMSSVAISWLLSFVIISNFNPSYVVIFKSLPAAFIIQVISIMYFRLDRIVARFISLPDLIRILKSVFFACFITAIFEFQNIQQKAVFVLDPLILTILLAGGRTLYRLYIEGTIYGKTGLRTLIIGAGRAGEALARELLRKDQKIYLPVGFLDDDRLKAGKEILGVRVVGRTRDLAQIVRRLDIEMALLAIPSAAPKTVRRITKLCHEANIPCRTLPSIQKLLTSKADISTLHDITTENLLGRAPISLDWDGIRSQIEDKTILVSGAGGSIGSELCCQIASLDPKKIILLEISEFGLYQIEMTLKEQYPNREIKAILADIRDRDSLLKIFKEERPSLVFHTAAYKHVPMVEKNPLAGIKTNIFGTKNIADVSSESGVEKFILISTDKAVNPTSVMGATKRIAELYCQNMTYDSNTAFIITRFGNVLESSGSVVPLFKRQMANGGPLTVTHPEIRRYFMTTSEACQLVLQASALGCGGEIFVLDMGEPVKILDMAEQIIRLAGFTPYTDIPIVFTGLRPGEKLYEELFYREERLTPTAHPKLLLAKGAEVDWQWLKAKLNGLKVIKDPLEIKIYLKSIINEYQFAENIIPPKLNYLTDKIKDLAKYKEKAKPRKIN
ncbi:MAG: polysaccharide biosynthesis protein [Dissulfurimicrobium hydrothermale]|uniref:polysaccharide biosynthesis protein n=1 Tax=Dissulfurimicrobium hydrothermale TaxID=1750598 RepID=UPI003C775CB4